MIHFFIGVQMADRKAQAAVSHIMDTADRQQNMAGIQAAEFYDDEMNIVDVQKDGTGNAYYIRIINAEKAPGLFSWLNDQYGFEYPQGEFEDGDVFSYYTRCDEWINLINQKKLIEQVEAAFRAKEGEKNG